MGRLILWGCLLFAAWYAYTSGIINAIISGNVPPDGRICYLAGPKSGHVFLVLKKENVSLPFDATIGYNLKERRPAQNALATLILNGSILCPPDNTQVEVLDHAVISVYQCPHKITKVKILSGAFKGKAGWVQRDDVIDTPIQQLIQAVFRDNAKFHENELENTDATAIN